MVWQLTAIADPRASYDSDGRWVCVRGEQDGPSPLSEEQEQAHTECDEDVAYQVPEGFPEQVFELRGRARGQPPHQSPRKNETEDGGQGKPVDHQ